MQERSVAFHWRRNQQRPSWRRDRRSPLPSRQAVAITIVAVAAFATVALYKIAGQSPGQPAEVLVRSSDAAATPAAETADAARAGQAAAAGTIAAAAVEPGVPTRPTIADLLRPGAELQSEIDLPLDGSATGQVAVASRYTVTNGCEPQFADLFSVVGGKWTRVFAASDESLPYGAILPQPARSSAGCFPKIRLFSAEPAGPSGKALLLLGVAYADTSLRLVTLGWDDAAGAPAIKYDWRTGTNGTLVRNGNSVQIAEDAGMPPALSGAGVPGPIGRLSQVVTLADGSASVTSRQLSPTCDRGKVGSGTTRGLPEDGSDPILVLQCPSGITAALVPSQIALSPSGVLWTDIRDGDSVQVEFDPASLEPDSLETAVPTLATLADSTAATRRQAGARPPRQPAAPIRSQAPRSGSGPSAAPAPGNTAPRPAQPSQRQSSSSQTGAAPAAAATKPPVRRSSGPPAPPAVAVTAPPPPRTPPFAGPPPAPPR